MKRSVDCRCGCIERADIEDAEDLGAKARRSMVELTECPYPEGDAIGCEGEPEDPWRCRMAEAWRRGWTAEERTLYEQVTGRRRTAESKATQ